MGKLSGPRRRLKKIFLQWCFLEVKADEVSGKRFAKQVYSNRRLTRLRAHNSRPSYQRGMHNAISWSLYCLALFLYKEACGNYLEGPYCTQTPLGLETLWLGLTHTHTHTHAGTGQRVMAQPTVVMASLSACECVHATAHMFSSEHAPTESI